MNDLNMNCSSNVSEDVSRRRSRLAKQERQMDETILEIEHDDMLL